MRPDRFLPGAANRVITTSPKKRSRATKPHAPKAADGGRTEALLRVHALAYPETREDFPWGERVIKVRDKVFLFLGRGEGGLSLSVKLPVSGILALGLPFASPTAYGLGKSGWVTARFAPRDKAPVEMLRQWVDESYRAVAPRKLVAALTPPGHRPRAPR